MLVGAGARLFHSEVRIHRIELAHLAVRAPAQVAVPGVSQIEVRDLLEAARGVKARRQLVGERLVVDKAVCLRRTDGLFVKVHGIERAAINPGNLRTNQRGAVLEVFRASRRPDLELSVVRGQCL